MPKTIVFIHGAWVTPACWEFFKRRYEARGHTCIAPAWPFDERPVAELRRQPEAGLAGLGIAEIVEAYAAVIKALPEPPILMGHSFGGLFVQLLLDRGLGAAGVAIDPGPPRGVLPAPTAVRAALFVFLTWAGWRKAVTMPFKAFQWGFAHTLPADQQRAAFVAHIVPTPGRIYYQAVLGRHTAVDFANDQRAPLLLIAGEFDRTATAGMTRAMYRKHSASKAVTAFKEFAGRTHWLIAAPGWEEVADHAITWAEQHARG
jgi:pimeloyl-ACP methyl ester carboxylesterase